MTLKRTWDVKDATGLPLGTKQMPLTTIGPGRHEVERIPHPTGMANVSWLVLKGTKIGCSEGFWRQWTDETGEFQVVIED